jgi:hypothetical protein
LRRVPAAGLHPRAAAELRLTTTAPTRTPTITTAAATAIELRIDLMRLTKAARAVSGL